MKNTFISVKKYLLIEILLNVGMDLLKRMNSNKHDIIYTKFNVDCSSRLINIYLKK